MRGCVVSARWRRAGWLGVRSGHPALMAWFPLCFLVGALPAVDLLLGHDPGQPRADAEAALEHDSWFRAITLAALPVQVVLLAWSGGYLLQALKKIRARIEANPEELKAWKIGS